MRGSATHSANGSLTAHVSPDALCGLLFDVFPVRRIQTPGEDTVKTDRNISSTHTPTRTRVFWAGSAIHCRIGHQVADRLVVLQVGVMVAGCHLLPALEHFDLVAVLLDSTSRRRGGVRPAVPTTHAACRHCRVQARLFQPVALLSSLVVGTQIGVQVVRTRCPGHRPARERAISGQVGRVAAEPLLWPAWDRSPTCMVSPTLSVVNSRLSLICCSVRPMSLQPVEPHVRRQSGS